MDYESASQRSLSTSPNLVLCYVPFIFILCGMDHDGPKSRVTEKRGLDDWHRIGSSQRELCVGQPSLQPSLYA